MHGDSVRDVAFTVDDAAGIYNKAVSRGATSVKEPETLEDENGSVITASVRTFGDTVHTFVQRQNYNGIFLPGYQPHPSTEPLNGLVPIPELLYLDHVVGNNPQGEMNPTCDWYEQMLDWHRFFSIDDKLVHTQFSSLNSTVMADFDERVKMPFNEPADGLRVSQVQEFCDYYGGPGVQHIAMRTEDIITTV